MYKIVVAYLDADDNVIEHIIDDSSWLTYDDLSAEPIKVRRIKREGLIIQGKDRAGTIIPSHRIMWIAWEDDYL